MFKMIMKRLSAVLLTIVMVLGIVPAFSVSAAYENTHVNTGNQREDIVAIAETQKGYQEGSDAGTTAGSNNYTKYNAALYTIDGSYKYMWCQSFVAWCAIQAGVSSSVIKRTAGTIDAMDFFKAQGVWQASSSKGGSYIPQRGDIIYFTSGSSNSGYHVGIVTGCNGTTVNTIEGNKNSYVDNSVKKTSGGIVWTETYDLSSSKIIGYAVPKYSGGDVVVEPEPLTWATLSTQDNRTLFAIGENVLFTPSSDNAEHYTIGIDYEGERIITTSGILDGETYPYAFNFTGNYTAYVSAYQGDSHIESNIISYKVVNNVNSPTWAMLSTQDNRTLFEMGENVLFTPSSDNAEHYTIGIDYEGERIITTSGILDGETYPYAFNFAGHYTAYVSAYKGDNHIESNIISFYVIRQYVGDLNQDAATTLSDAILLQKYLLAIKTLTAEQKAAADMNSDGKVNIFDLNLLKAALK